MRKEAETEETSYLSHFIIGGISIGEPEPPDPPATPMLYD